MFNISENVVQVDENKYKSFGKTQLYAPNILFRRWMLGLSLIGILILFLPWTQNVRTKGQVTTLTPDQRPQTIHATIAGRVERWYVREGELVRKGDTIVHLSEVKTDYFDADLLPRTQAQVEAKSNAVVSYGSKARALDNQIDATLGELKFKKEQLANKIEQTKLKAEGEKNELAAGKIDLETEQIQLVRTEELFKQGLKSKTDVENKRLKLQQTQAKLVVLDNKYAQSLQEVENLKVQLNGAESEYAAKVAKMQSDKFSTLSEQFDAEATVNKLKNQYANYSARAQFYYVTAPQDCYITAATTVGIGETVKEGDPIVAIVPAHMDLAVEMFINPIDLPLVKIGAPVRFIFDGWPAFIFSGWPNASVGTSAGRVFAVDNVANLKGQYRILVAPDPDTPAWPPALRPGGGANGFALFKDVPVWYEIWRQLNGFPPEYYTGFQTEQKEKK
jgi:membrane fusion protein, adhesin transport system